MNRRDFFQLTTCAMALTFSDQTAHAHTTNSNHPHPHRKSHTPSHLDFGLTFRSSIEQSFLKESSRRFASMTGCEVVIQHGHLVVPEPLEVLSTVNEHVPFFVNHELGIRDMSKRDLYGVLSGSINNWSEVGGPDKRIVVLNRNSRNYRSATAGVIAHNFLDGSDHSVMRAEETFSRNIAQSDDRVLRSMRFEPGIRNRHLVSPEYSDVARVMQSFGGAFAISLRPHYAGSRVPISVDGVPFMSDHYPISVESHVTFRGDVPSARSLAEQVLHKMETDYEQDALTTASWNTV